MPPRPDQFRASLPVDLDEAHLAEQSGGDQELAREVLALFVSRAPVLLARIAEGGPDARDAAHALKGAALALGAWQVATAAEAVERAAAEGRPYPLDSLAAAVFDACRSATLLLQRAGGPLAFGRSVA